MTYKHRTLIQVEFTFDSKAERQEYYKSLDKLGIVPFAAKGDGLSIDHIYLEAHFKMLEKRFKDVLNNKNGTNLKLDS